MNRFKAATRTNDTQFSAVVMMSLLTTGAAAQNPNIPAWGVGIAFISWPVIAFVTNLFSPIP